MPTFGVNQEKAGLEAKFYELCEKVAAENSLALYDLDYLSGQSLLRVYIMDNETQSAVLEDCVKLDRALTPFIEESDWMPEELTVEVSSPGIFRSLKDTKHFEWSIGKRISVTIQGDLAGDYPKNIKSAKNYIGSLEAVEENNIVVNLENKKLAIPIEFSCIKKAQWEPKF